MLFASACVTRPDDARCGQKLLHQLTLAVHPDLHDTNSQRSHRIIGTSNLHGCQNDFRGDDHSGAGGDDVLRDQPGSSSSLPREWRNALPSPSEIIYQKFSILTSLWVLLWHIFRMRSFIYHKRRRTVEGSFGNGIRA